MHLQLKILRMKKRLYKEPWLLPMVTITLCGLSFILVSLMQIINLPMLHGVVSLDIPIVSIPFDDPGLSDFKETPKEFLNEKSPAVVLNSRGDFFFGEIQAFSKDLSGTRNKFIISSVEGRPDLTSLILTMKKWRKNLNDEEGLGSFVVFMPSPQVPINVVIQVVAYLKKRGDFSHVVLGSEMI